MKKIAAIAMMCLFKKKIKMRRKYPLILKFFLFASLFWGVERFCHKQTHGFQLHKVLSKHAEEDIQGSDYAISEEEKRGLQTVFFQPFYFLGSGGQSYAFVSQDGKTVLKLFKNHRIRLWKFLHGISLPALLDVYRQRFLNKIIHQSPAFFESCKISYLEFKERTGLIYLHLHKTDFIKKKLTIVDNLGIAHQIDLDSTDFALQKKAEFFKPKLKKLMENNDLNAAKQCIDSYLGLIVERCKKGIADHDPNFRRNVGFIGNLAVEIDLGSYTKDESIKSRENFKLEVLDKTQKFKGWMQRKDPGLFLYLSDRIDQILQENEESNINPRK